MSNNLKDYNHIGLLFPSNYLSGPDLRGQDVVVTIESIEPRHELRRSDDTTDAKPAVTFVDHKKMWVMNKTNALTIAGMHGNEVTKWVGKPITLYAAKVRAFGSVHDAIRVRERAPTVEVPLGISAVLASIAAAPDKKSLESIAANLPGLSETDKAKARAAYKAKIESVEAAK